MSKRVLVTGGAGFIGSHIAEAYLADGWDVTVLDDLSRGKEANIPDGAGRIVADVRSDEARQAVATGRFDVLNLHAAQIDVRVSVTDPRLDAEINLLGLVNMVEGAAAGGVGRVVFASSGGVVYGDPETIPTPESAPKEPISPYGVSKLSGEHYLRTLAELRGFEAVALRYSNVYGPRQDPQSEAGVVSIFVSRLLRRMPLTIFGDGTQTRDYVFVGDVARANLALSTGPLPGGRGIDARAFNIATSRETSVVALAEAVGRVMEVTPELTFAPPRAGELTRSVLAIDKVRATRPWSPATDLEAGLQHLITWFREEGM